MITIDYSIIEFIPPSPGLNPFIKVELHSYSDPSMNISIKFNHHLYKTVSVRRNAENLEERIDAVKRIIDHHHRRIDKERFTVLVSRSSDSNRDPYYALYSRVTRKEYEMRLPRILERALHNEMNQYSWIARNLVGFNIMLDIYEELLSRIKNDTH